MPFCLFLHHLASDSFVVEVLTGWFHVWLSVPLFKSTMNLDCRTVYNNVIDD